MKSEITGAAGRCLYKPVVETLVQSLARIGSSEVNDGRRAACCLCLCPGIKVIRRNGSGYVKVKMGMCIDKPRKYQFAGRIFRPGRPGSRF